MFGWHVVCNDCNNAITPLGLLTEKEAVTTAELHCLETGHLAFAEDYGGYLQMKEIVQSFVRQGCIPLWSGCIIRCETCNEVIGRTKNIRQVLTTIRSHEHGFPGHTITKQPIYLSEPIDTNRIPKHYMKEEQ
ncbi:Hypothetical protein LUCI_2680 [Lucifera butyrica]|uniref:Uncharacterized protein n=1 Tax=Lucifera butyrica TaxID=1351585 RepID=A0A498R7S2_9FIRM|nr:hypothetical protein [Lucifera butyrica]VBB07431.1 Hypothetical protein LUCI_2680 [Lucifera butyrica]